MRFSIFLLLLHICSSNLENYNELSFNHVVLIPKTNTSDNTNTIPNLQQLVNDLTQKQGRNKLKFRFHKNKHIQERWFHEQQNISPSSP